MHVAFKRGSCAFMSVCPVLPRSPLAVRRLCRQRRDPRGRWRGCAAAADVLLPQVSPSFPDLFLVFGYSLHGWLHRRHTNMHVGPTYVHMYLDSTRKLLL